MSNNKTNVAKPEKTNSPSNPQDKSIGTTPIQNLPSQDLPSQDKAFAQAYQKTGIAKAMDDTNKQAMEVWANKGSDAAVTHMMQQAGGDYARMRSMFG